MDAVTKTFLKTVCKKHRGTISQMGRDLGINPCSITLWFQGKYSSPRLDREVPCLLQAYGLPHQLPQAGRREFDPLEAVL